MADRCISCTQTHTHTLSPELTASYRLKFKEDAVGGGSMSPYNSAQVNVADEFIIMFVVNI